MERDLKVAVSLETQSCFGLFVDLKMTNLFSPFSLTDDYNGRRLN